MEVLVRWSEAIRHGDLAEELWDPEAEIVNAKGWVVEASYHGHQGLRQWWSDLEDAFSDFRMEVEEITPLDEHRFLTAQRFVGQFRFSEIPFDARWASVLTVRDGRIARAVGYFSKEQALRQLGRASGRESPGSVG